MSDRTISRNFAPGLPATDNQLRYLRILAHKAGYDAAALDARSHQEFGVDAQALTRGQCSHLIDLIGKEPRTRKDA